MTLIELYQILQTCSSEVKCQHHNLAPIKNPFIEPKELVELLIGKNPTLSLFLYYHFIVKKNPLKELIKQLEID